MKVLVPFLLALSATSYGATVSESVAQVELNHNVRCEKLGTRLGRGCNGRPAGSRPASVYTCFYAVNYLCGGAQDFQLTVKAKDTKNPVTGKRVTKVSKLVFKY